MLQQVMRVGSFFLVISTYLSAMERPTLKELAIKRVANLIISNSNPGYCIKAFDTLPNELVASVIQQIVATNTYKSALPVVLLSYKLYQQQQLDRKQYQLRLLLANNHQVELAPDQSDQLIQASVTIQSIIQDIEEQIEEIPLPLLTQEQVINLLSYIPIINAIDTSNSVLPIVQQEIPEAAAQSSYWIKYTAVRQLKEHITAQTVSTLCDLIIAASYLDIQSDQQNINFIELATCALGDKLLQSSEYQDKYDVISTLPANVQHMLVQYLINNSAVRYALCGNSTDVITNTAQTLTGHTDKITSVSWSPNDKHIASGSGDKTVRVWDVNTGTCTHILKGHTDGVTSVSWSPDGSTLVSCSCDKTIKLWHIIDKQRDHYLKAALSWEQALLLVRLINAHHNQQDIDFTHDIKALHCYENLDQQVKQLVEPLLSEKTCSALHATNNLERLIRANPAQAALFGVGLQIGRIASLRK